MSSRTTPCLATLIAFQLLLPGCEAKPEWEDFQGGTHLVLEVESSGDLITDTRNVSETKNILDRRMKQLGIKRRIIREQGERQIVLQLPNRPEGFVDVIIASTLLEFKRVRDAAPNAELLRARYRDGLPENTEIVVADNPDGSVFEAYLVPDEAVLTGDMLADAHLDYDRRQRPRQRPIVTFKWNSEGTKIFREFTSANIGERLAVIIDGVVISAPVLQSAIGRNGQIDGNFTPQEAANLAVALRSGALPVPIKVIESEELTRDTWLGNVEQ